MRSIYYRVCEYCGSNLDPGERCDCQSAQKPVRSVFPAKSIKYPIRGEKSLRRAVRAS